MAQTTLEPPNNPDYGVSATTPNNILNTGADYIENYIPGSTSPNGIKVMVFDGDVPQFAWENIGNSGKCTFALDDIKDPDVVLTNNSEFALVVYEDNNQIYLDLWQWNGPNFVEVLGNLGNYNFPYLIDEGTNPNIDLQFTDLFAITWQDNKGNIKGLAGEYQGGQNFDISPNMTFINNSNSRTPDATIFENVITYTFIVFNDQLQEYWVTQQEQFNDVYNGNSVNSPIILHQANLDLGGKFGRPRIASPNDQYFDDNDYTSVVDYYTITPQGVSKWEILGMQNSFNNLFYPPKVYNNNIFLLPNKEPVVTYNGDIGIIAWTAYIQYPGQSNYSYDVIERQFQTYSGGNTIQTFASIVNFDYDREQDIPSVSGRRSGTDGNVLYFYKNESPATMDMMHRIAPPYTQNLRLAKGTASNNFAFMLKSNELTITTDCDLYSFIITDVTGRKIIQNNNASKEVSIPTNTLHKGIYILNCTSKNESTVFKFIQIN